MDDMHSVIVPKSDQLNADDLIGGPITIKITKMVVAPAGEQRVSVFFEGDNGKPFKPSKSMARVMVYAWGEDSKAYVGKSMTLYRDENVKWGGVKVGGIRVSHMSDVEGFTIALTETRKSRVPFTVAPLKAARAARQEGAQTAASETREDAPEDDREAPAAGDAKLNTQFDHTLARFGEMTSAEVEDAIQTDFYKRMIKALSDAGRVADIRALADARAKAMERSAPQDDGFPGDQE